MTVILWIRELIQTNPFLIHLENALENRKGIGLIVEMLNSDQFPPQVLPPHKTSPSAPAFPLWSLINAACLSPAFSSSTLQPKPAAWLDCNAKVPMCYMLLQSFWLTLWYSEATWNTQEYYAITGKLHINQIDCLSLYKIRSPLLLLLLLGLFLAQLLWTNKD